LPAKAASLALQWLQLHPCYRHRLRCKNGREPCPESQAFFCGVSLFLRPSPTIAYREPGEAYVTSPIHIGIPRRLRLVSPGRSPRRRSGRCPCSPSCSALSQPIYT